MAAGSIVVDLLMKTGSFETDTKKAAKALKQMEKEAVAVGKAIGAALVGATAAFGYMIKSSIDSADAMSKLAQSAGVSVETLTSLSFAADLSGISGEQLGKAFGKLSVNMSDAAKGTGEAMDAFAAMGISIKDANGNLKASDKVMMEVADRFASYEDGAGKSALAMKIFGKAGLDMIPMLNSGADGLRAMQDEASALGLVIDTQTAKAAEEFNDTLSRLMAVQKGFTNQVMEEMLKPLQDLASMFLDLAKNTDIAKKFSNGLLDVFKGLVIVGSNLIFVYKGIQREIGGAAAQAAAFFGGEWEQAKVIGPMIRLNSEEARKELDAFQARIEALGTGKGASGTAKFDTGFTLPSGATKLSAPMIIDSKKAETERNKLFAEQEKLLAEGEKSWVNYADAVLAEDEELTAQLRDLTLQQVADREAGQKLMMQQVFDRIDAEEDAAIAAGELIVQQSEENSKKLEKFNNDLGMSFTSAFEDAIRGGKGMGDILKSLINDLIVMTTRMLVLEPLMRSVMGGVRGSGIGGAILSFFGGAMASGGDVMGGRSYLVGENGPEMFTPRTTGSITPNGGGSGGTIVQNINITTGIQQTVRAEIMSMMPQIANVAKSAVADAKLRGGSYASAMR